MIVNGLVLPELLCRLVEAGTWKRPVEEGPFRQLTKIARPQDFTFLDFDGMARETRAARQLASDLTTARLYGLKALGVSEVPNGHEGLLDIAKAVMIAVNWDEDAIFLDYRKAAEPSIVLSCWSNASSNAICREIAPNFGAFAEAIGLPKVQAKTLK